MTQPINREQLQEYCLRRLGKPVISINVSQDQIEDRTDDAFQFFVDWHPDATETTYLAHAVTNTDKINKYIEFDANTDGQIVVVKQVFPFSMSTTSGNFFDVRYQFLQNELHNMITQGGLPYYKILKEHLRDIEMLLVGQKPHRFNRHQRRIYIDMDWDHDIQVDQFILLECIRVIDPDAFTDIYSDRFLKQYLTALLKRQWGENLSKFVEISLPGGVKLNGDVIRQQAIEEIDKLEQAMADDYGGPLGFVTA